MNTQLMKRLVISTWAALSLAGLLLTAALLGTICEPSVEGRKWEIQYFASMPGHLDWKPTALSAIKSRQQLWHGAIVAFRVVAGVSLIIVLVSAANIAWLLKLARSPNDNCA